MMQDRRSRQYAVVLFLPEFLSSMIAGLREKYDPDYSIVDPHITLVFPFDSDLQVDEIAAAIWGVTDRQAPFEVILDDLGDFYPTAPIIFWRVRVNTILNSLYLNLTKGLRLDLPFKDYVPHVTVAREISDFRVMMVKENICSYISGEKFAVEAIDLITPLTDNRWVSVRTFPLRGK